MSSTTFNGVSIIPLVRTKSRKFALRKHDFVGFVFGLLVISPMWLVLVVPNFAASLTYKYGTESVTKASIVFPIVVFLLSVVFVPLAKAKDGSK